MNNEPQETTSKCGACCNKMKEWTSYNKLYISDLIIAVIHIIVMLCLKIQYLMMIPFILIRLPRFILHCYARKSNTRLAYDREF